MKNVFKILSFVCFFSLISCEKDIYEEAVYQKKRDFKFKTVGFKELRENHPKVVNSFFNLQSGIGLETNLRTINVFGFEIDATNIICLEKEDGYESYTFKINQEEGLSYFKNLVINIYPNGSMEIVITKFNLSKTLEEVREENTLHESIISNEVARYDNSNSTFSFYSCLELGYYITVDACEGELVTPEENPECFDENGNRATKEVFVLLAADCGFEGGENFSNPNNGFNDGFWGNPNEEPSGYNGNLTGVFIVNPYNGNPSSTDYNIDIDENLLDLNIQVFTNGLNHDQQQVFYSNPELSEYLVTNNASVESRDFVLELINIVVQNGLEIEFNPQPQPIILDEINNLNDLNQFVQSINFDVEDNSLGATTMIDQNKSFSSKTIELTQLIDLTIEVVANLQPTISLDNNGCTSYISNVVVGNTWVQNSMTITSPNYSSTFAQITLSGYVNIGISLEEIGLNFGIKQRMIITFLIDKTTGAICCSTTTKL